MQWIDNGKRLVLVPSIGSSVVAGAWNPETGDIEQFYALGPCGSDITGFYLSADGHSYAIAMYHCG
jgi:hypothetical protein